MDDGERAKTKTPILTVGNLRYTYDGAEEPALNGLNFGVNKGEIFGFLGPSGAGKSTTQKVLIGLLDDYEGEAEVFGRCVHSWGSDLYNQIGIAAETPNLYQKLTGRENLELFASLYGGAKRDPIELLERVGISDAADRRVGTYSKGMQMRLNFVRALIHNPEIVFLDEPTGGIDPGNARSVEGVIEEIRTQGTTVFLTTHDMAVADKLCDRVAFIVNGSLPVINSPRKLKLAHGRATVRVEFRANDALESREFSLPDLDSNEEFHTLLRENQIETMHTEEATLEDVFIEVTGEELA